MRIDNYLEQQCFRADGNSLKAFQPHNFFVPKLTSS